MCGVWGGSSERRGGAAPATLVLHAPFARRPPKKQIKGCIIHLASQKMGLGLRPLPSASLWRG
jgi:hypothetical protein